MGLMNSMRNKGGLLVGVIGFAIVAFLAGDILISGRNIFGGGTNDIGKVAGEAISYTSFQEKLEQNTNSYKTNTGMNNLDENTNGYLMDQTWNQMVYDIILKKELEATGVSVSGDELFDMIQGSNPHPEVKKAFTDPKVGIFDPSRVIEFLKNMDQNDPSGETRKQWLAFEKSIKEERIRQKYFNLIKGAMYVTSLQAKTDYLDKNKTIDIQYVMLDYATVSDSSVKVAEADIEKYYNANKYKYKQKEAQRSFDYIYLDITPSVEDTQAVVKWINEQALNLKSSTDDSSYINLNAETKYTGAYAKKGELSPILDSNLFSAPVGTVYGPYLEANAYKVAKLISSKMLPDSVKARHILIPSANGNTESAKQKADSIKKAIDGGADFAVLAKQFSSDNSKDKGGDLGYFDSKTMVKPFSDACFFGKKGDRMVVETQFGVHIIEIVDQKNFTTQVQVGIIDRTIEPSSTTTRTLYAKATNILSTVKNPKDFENIKLNNGINKRVAENIGQNDRFVAGLENPRELIRWAFKAEQDEISPLFEVGNKYVFARLTQVKDKGFTALEYVKKEIESIVRKEKKGEQLASKLEKAMQGTANLDQLALKVTTAAQSVQGLNFSSPVIPGIAREPKVVGTIFALSKGKISKPIQGERGVYVAMLTAVNDPVPLADYTPIKTQLYGTIKGRADGEVMEALKDKSDIIDNRYSFY